MSNRGFQPVISPCIGVCTLDRDEVCMGCHRTAHEIVHWMDYSDSERAAICEALDERAHRNGTA